MIFGVTMASNKKAKRLINVSAGTVSPVKWDGHESWSADEYKKNWWHSMHYYRLESSVKALKPKVIKWMQENGFSKEEVALYKKGKDWRTSISTAGVIANLIKGMPAKREDFNGGRDAFEYVIKALKKIIEESKDDVEDEEEVKKKNTAPQPSIQERLREVALSMTTEIEDAYHEFSQDPDKFDPKSIKVLNLLRAKETKAAHARIIRDFYIRDYEETLEALEGVEEQIVEGYGYLTKTQLKKLNTFLHDIIGACDIIQQESKVSRKPRIKKAEPTKLVRKLKFKATDEVTKTVSINPVDIIGAEELWVYNAKTRKLGKYVAIEHGELSVKGTSVQFFDESLSVQKTLRKPVEQLAEFKKAGKVALRKFLDDIKTTEIKLNGRINEETVLLKVQ